MTDILKRLGEFFRAHRHEAQLEQHEVIEELGLPSIQTLEAYETGAVPIPLDEVFALANLYNIAPDMIVRLLYALSVEIAEAEACTQQDVARK